MTYAIIEASGKQFRVEPGRFYDIDRLHREENDTITIDRVLYVSHEGDIMVGQPLVEGATVSATVMRHLRGRKIIVYKMKPKKKTRKKRGHRQELTRLMVDAINLNGKVLAGEAISASTQSESTAPAVEAATAEVAAPEATAATAATVATATAVQETAPAVEVPETVEEAPAEAEAPEAVEETTAAAATPEAPAAATAEAEALEAPEETPEAAAEEE